MTLYFIDSWENDWVDIVINDNVVETLYNPNGMYSTADICGAYPTKDFISSYSKDLLWN